MARFSAASVCILMFSAMLVALTGCAQSGKKPASEGRPADADPAVVAERRQQELSAVRSHIAGYSRITRVSYGLLRTAAPNCLDRRRMSLGVTPMDSGVFPKAIRPAAERIYNFRPEGGLIFFSVPVNSPAYRAGVREGDVLVSAQGKVFLPGKTAMYDLERWVDSLPPGSPLKLDVKRGGEVLHLDVMTEMVCDHRFVFDPTDVVNALNLFDTTIVLGGIPRIMERDSDLAVVLAHEMAHGFLRHSARSLQAVADKTPLTPAQQAEAELEADELGLRLAAAAGHDISRAEEVMRKLGQAAPTSINTATTHPTSPERFIALKRQAAEITARARRGESLFSDQRRMSTYYGKEFEMNSQLFQAVSAKVPWIDMPPRGTMNTVPFNLPVDDPRLGAWADIPAIDIDARVAYQGFLRDSRRPRAFAVSAQGAWGVGYGDGAAAKALGDCEARGGRGCLRYAEDNHVVATDADLLVMKQAVAGRFKVVPTLAAGHTRQVPPPSGFAAIDDVDAVPVLPQFRKGYADYLTRKRPAAFVIREKGGYRAGSGADAMERLLGDCERAGEVCWLYAVDDTVVWQRDVAKRISSVRQLTAPVTASAQR